MYYKGKGVYTVTGIIFKNGTSKFSFFTKKKERIEEGDITHNIRNDPSRYNDSITNWQKGKNMMVAVDYGSDGSSRL